MTPRLPPDEWLRPSDRLAILTHGNWGPTSSGKTGIQVVRYAPCTVAGVVEPDHVGVDAARGWGITGRSPVPTFATLDDLLQTAGPITRVLVGIAPAGGRLPPAMRGDICTAIEQGIPVLSGLHNMLDEDPEFGPLAARHGTPLVDLRRPPDDPVCADGRAAMVPIPVVATYGTDARCGKMTVCAQLREVAKDAGLRVAFVATGQTGLLLQPDAGAPVDRVISDFAAGEVERQVVAAARLDEAMRRTEASPDLILVEGQGALSHPAFGAVTLAVLHGSAPDALLLCHDEGRRHKTSPTYGAPWPVQTPAAERDAVERLLALHRRAPTAALCLATPGLSDDALRETKASYQHEMGIPAFDVLRGDAEALLRHLIQHLHHARAAGALDKPVPTLGATPPQTSA